MPQIYSIHTSELDQVTQSSLGIFDGFSEIAIYSASNTSIQVQKLVHQ